MDLPVTLVIKAPNQRVDDHTVDCMQDWTVKKLKQHLTSVYPSQPTETQQKLIYSGKLLQDHLTLKEVLRQFDDGSNKHTVHLVCSFSPKSESRSFTKKKIMESQTHSRHSSSSSDQSQASGSPHVERHTDGLRHRGHPHLATSPSQHAAHSQQTFNPYSAYMNQMPMNPAQFVGGFPTEAAMFGGMMPDAGMAYSPEQYVWMQQMYAQYMAQYMQYYQQGGYPTPPNTPVTPTPPPPAQNAQDNQAEAEEAEVEEFEEEFRQRDWLDYVYTFSRFMVLLGIVYFYSSLTRFLMVGVFFLFVYAYQMGWFMLRLNRRAQQGQQQNVEEDVQQAQQVDNQPPPDNIQGENANSESSPSEAPAPPQEPPAPGMLKVTWTFVSTFFTSLFPAPPPAVNVN